jgi:hypothetical protein
LTSCTGGGRSWTPRTAKVLIMRPFSLKVITGRPTATTARRAYTTPQVSRSHLLCS